MASIDNTWSIRALTGTDGKSIVSVVPLYCETKTSSAPNKPTASSETPWTTTRSTFNASRFYWICYRSTDNKSGKTYSDVEVDIGYQTLGGSVTDAKKVYRYYKGGVIPTPPTKESEIISTIPTNDETWTYQKITSTDVYKNVLSCTVYKKYGSTDLEATIVTIDIDTIIDTDNGLIQTNLIDVQSLLAHDITLKNNGFIQSSEYESGSNGFKLDAATGEINAVGGTFKSVNLENLNSTINVSAGNTPFAYVSAGILIGDVSHAPHLRIEADNKKYLANKVSGNIKVRVVLRLDGRFTSGSSIKIKGSLYLFGKTVAVNKSEIATGSLQNVTYTVTETIKASSLNSSYVDFVSSESYKKDKDYDVKLRMFIIPCSDISITMYPYRDLCEWQSWKIFNDYSGVLEDSLWDVFFHADGSAKCLGYFFENKEIQASHDYKRFSHNPINYDTSLNTAKRGYVGATPVSDQGAFTASIYSYSVQSFTNSSYLTHTLSYIFENKNNYYDATLQGFTTSVEGLWNNTDIS